MRTRIALVVAIPVAVISISTLAQAATEQPARAVGPSTPTSKDSSTINLPPTQLAAYRGLSGGTTTGAGSNLLLNLNSSLLTGSTSTSAFVAPITVSQLPFTAAATALTTAVTVPVAPVVAAPPPPPAPVAAPAPPATPGDTVTPAQRAAWERVAICEEGGNWQADGSRFSGGLGITRTNWIAYGGREFASEGAMATEDQQIMVAERIQYSPPDQGGCHGW